MLAELRRQGEIRSRFPEVRKTFEDFLKGAQVISEDSFLRRRPKIWWTREEKLSHQGEDFTLLVTTPEGSSSLSNAKLRIEVSTDDGRKTAEYLPSLAETQSRFPEATGEILDRLSDLEEVVRKFNQSRPRIRPLF